MAKKDYYEILGVQRTVTEKELKVAFRRLAMKYHPDKNPDNKQAEIQFKEIGEAYDILKDEQKRAAYDQYGHAAFENGMGGGGGQGFGGGGNASMHDIFEDLFGGAFGGGSGGGRQRQGGPQRGNDIPFKMEISLEEALTGKSATIEVPTSVSCESCDGSGAKKGTKPSTCGTCGGSGAVRTAQGFFTIERTCPTCEGRGQVITDPCSKCHGSGRVNKQRKLSVNIPAGVEDGTRIRLANEGEAGVRGGASGDLYIFLSIKPHEFFQRDGADLFCKVPISMCKAALGGEIEVPMVDGGKTRVKIPEGVQSGKQFRLRGKGMPILRSRQTGDMYIQVEVETPQKLSKRQKELLQEFEEGCTTDNHPGTHGFFTQVKKFWEDIKLKD